jgi:hypothetical protein
MKQYRSLAIFSLVALLLVSYNFMSAQWSAPTAVAPGDNTAAPINVGSVTQAKSGNLMANIMAAATSTWSPEYCDELGVNCWDPSTGAPGGGGGDDTITVGGRCFQPVYVVTCNWNWSGDGNDNSTYTGPLYTTPAQICAAANRSYQYHTTALGECLPDGWSKTAWVRVGATNNYTRTVTCVEGATGSTLPDDNCPAPKPADTCTALGIASGGSSCPA